jgi:uncharacterized protein (TIGR03083 family)
MKLTPTYDGPPPLEIDGPLADQLVPLTRQRRRMQEMLASLTDEQWAAPSRCDGWRVQDVVTHLNDVNPFWQGSVAAGLVGLPTRFLDGFDPTATPAMLVDMSRERSSGDVLEQFVRTNEKLVDELSAMDEEQWAVRAETPVGHPSIRVLAHHALWDAWIHERDIVLPLGMAPVEEPDEVRSCLRFAAAIGPTLALGLGRAAVGTYAVDATGPEVRFVLAVRDTVAIRDVSPGPSVPVLHGHAVDLVEALSLRTALPDDTPDEWRRVAGGLATAFG